MAVLALASRGRLLRGILAWICAVGAAGLAAASLTVVYALTRESLAHGAMPIADWWIFLNLWRPMVIGALVLGALASALPCFLGVWLIRRYQWCRPLADLAMGAATGIVSVATVIAVLRLAGPMSDGA